MLMASLTSDAHERQVADAPSRAENDETKFNTEPFFICRSKSGHISFVKKEPDITKRFAWYMSEPQQVTAEQLKEEMKLPNRRWFATDRKTYELSLECGCNLSEGEPYVCMRNSRNPSMYWFGKRHVKPPVEKAVLLLTVADIYLKSKLHQGRMFRILIDHVRRVLDNPQVFRSGDTMIEVRQKEPTARQLQAISLLPGVAKVYAAAEKRGGDPRGEFIMEGAGGNPILPDQRALCLLSGGIDSPVAAYRMMVRGCHMDGVHFLNSTNNTSSVVEKNQRICERLSEVQGKFVMHFVDISKLQTQIVAMVENHNRTLIYKWFMLSLAASMDDYEFVVVGDSIGQVASQTVFNVATLYPTISKAVVAPLIGTSKSSIVAEARKIGTFDISIQSGDDCCQYMMCKTGANLHIGPTSLRRRLARVKVPELPVLRQVYYNGKLIESSHFSLQPNIGSRQTASVSAAVPASNDEGKENGIRLAEHVKVDVYGEDDDDDRIYFDSAASSRVHPSVLRAMLAAPHGNPNSMHQSGRQARMAIEQVRVELARRLGVPAQDVIFTSGGTESNNIALHGCEVLREAWSHPSTAMNPPSKGLDAPRVRVVDLVHHETGSVNRDLRRPSGCRLHVDASQALGKVDFASLDLTEVDTMTVSAHKMNGPIGVGALYVRGLRCSSLFCGGSQENGLRPGTENVPGIVGFGAALHIDRSNSIHRDVEQLLVAELEGMGCEVNRRSETSGFIVHATLPVGYDNTAVVSMLSAKFGVDIGTGSACKTGTLNGTVYEVLGKPPAPQRAVRLSYDSFVTMSQAERVITSLRKVLQEIKP